ncbi:MAG TPA: hypothetical protein DEP77_08340 [Bacteroidales bacterium]|nr:hypothetical protein [Bacteroidales bacterium]
MVMIPATQADARTSMPLKIDRMANTASRIPAMMVIRYLFECFILFRLCFILVSFSYAPPQKQASNAKYQKT